MPSHRDSHHRQPLLAPREPRRLLTVGLMLMALATGCGPVSGEGEDSSPQSSDGTSQAAPGEEGNVSAQAACCYIRCADGGANSWRGPNSSVVYDNCANYGRYACGQHYWSFLGSKWSSC
jgi:hypothetical protein